MSGEISVIMPAFRAEATIADSVASVLAQTHARFELVIAADDGTDYAGVLAGAGIADPRIVHVSTGRVGSGSANARNVALDQARHRFVATLDADDRFARDKLENGLSGLARHPLVTTGLRLMTPAGVALRTIGCTGTTQLLAAADYKTVNLSMDSMVLWDRDKVPVRYDPDLPCFVDFDLMLKALGHVGASLHIGEPLHDYVKQPSSMSNAPGASPIYAQTKQRLIKRLKLGRYSFKTAKVLRALIRFLELSVEAEHNYETALAESPGLIFEDMLEPLLARSARLE